VGQGAGASVVVDGEVVTIGKMTGTDSCNVASKSSFANHACVHAGGIRHPEGTVLGNVYDHQIYAPASIDVLKLDASSKTWITVRAMR